MKISAADQVRLDSYKERLRLYIDAETKILEGQSYSIGSRSLSRANLAEVRVAINELEGKIRALERHGTTKRKVARIIPRDF